MTLPASFFGLLRLQMRFAYWYVIGCSTERLKRGLVGTYTNIHGRQAEPLERSVLSLVVLQLLQERGPMHDYEIWTSLKELRAIDIYKGSSRNPQYKTYASLDYRTVLSLLRSFTQRCLIDTKTQPDKRLPGLWRKYHFIGEIGRIILKS